MRDDCRRVFAGPVAQWITRLTTDQKILGSTPGWLGHMIFSPGSHGPLSSKLDGLQVSGMWVQIVPNRALPHSMPHRILALTIRASAELPDGLVVRIRRSHRRGPGSIPGQGSKLYRLL